MARFLQVKCTEARDLAAVRENPDPSTFNQTIQFKTDRAGDVRKRSLRNAWWVLSISAVVAALPARAQTASTAMPGGASSLQETFQDWRVTCSVVQNAKSCSVSQIQTQQNGQRVLAIELRAAKDGGAAGVLMLPFGLKLQDGVTMKIDQNPSLLSLSFSTCLPLGCVVPLNLTAANVATLESGTTLTVNASAADGSEKLSFPISLKGFAPVFERLNQLQKP